MHKIMVKNKKINGDGKVRDILLQLQSITKTFLHCIVNHTTANGNVWYPYNNPNSPQVIIVSYALTSHKIHVQIKCHYFLDSNGVSSLPRS